MKSRAQFFGSVLAISTMAPAAETPSAGAVCDSPASPGAMVTKHHPHCLQSASGVSLSFIHSHNLETGKKNDRMQHIASPHNWLNCFSVGIAQPQQTREKAAGLMSKYSLKCRFQKIPTDTYWHVLRVCKDDAKGFNQLNHAAQGLNQTETCGLATVYPPVDG